MIMHSESKEIYGVSVLPVLVVLHQIHRRRALRELRMCWDRRHSMIRIARRNNWHFVIHTLDIESQYFMVRQAAKYNQRRGII